MSCTIVLFEDPFVDRLRPINLARPTYQVTCGALCLRDLLHEFALPIQSLVRPHLRALVERDGQSPAKELRGPILYLNAAIVPDLATIARLKELIAAKQPFLALNDQRVTAAWSPADMPGELPTRNAAELQAYLLDQRLPILDDEFPMLEHFFDVIRHHERLLPSHLALVIERNHFKTYADNVFVGEDCVISSRVEFDASDGPIVLGNRVRIRPFSYIAGPVRVGDRALIIDHAAIKHGSVLGHTVKAGGEIEASIIEPYSNKQHHGFLGHAYVGSWVNLGAGTSNSDLKNTYGEISIDMAGKSVNTGMQFVGCAIGDYTKTAINTSIFTGKLIGVASFLYGFIGTNVPSITNYARSFGQVTEVSVDVAIKAQTRCASRRNVVMTSADTLLLQDLFEMTRSERQLSAEQVAL